MRIVWVVPCERAEKVNRRLNATNVGVNQMVVERLPCLIQICLLIRGAAYLKDLQTQHEFRVDVMDSGGNRIHTESGPYGADKPSPLMRPGVEDVSDTYGYIRFPVSDVGRHDVVIFLDGKRTTEFPVTIIMGD
jgi:hypothetical protein